MIQLSDGLEKYSDKVVLREFHIPKMTEADEQDHETITQELQPSLQGKVATATTAPPRRYTSSARTWTVSPGHKTSLSSTRQTESEEVGKGLSYQAAVRAGVVSPAPKLWAARVTQENSPKSSGVV